MSNFDAVPTMEELPNNRVGALYEACYKFLQKRQAMNDIASCIMYNSNSTVLFESQKVCPTLVTSYMASVGADGGTSFVNAIAALKPIVDKNDDSKYVPLAIFMSDGECQDNGSTALLKSIVASHPEFKLSAVGLGKSDHGVLKDFASIGKGIFVKSDINIDSLVSAYEKILPGFKK